jgi:hypothetical protein
MVLTVNVVNSALVGLAVAVLPSVIGGPSWDFIAPRTECAAARTTRKLFGN